MSDRKLRVFVIWTVVEQKKRLDDEYLYRLIAISSNMAANSAQEGPTLRLLGVLSL